MIQPSRISTTSTPAESKFEGERNFWEEVGPKIASYSYIMHTGLLPGS